MRRLLNVTDDTQLYLSMKPAVDGWLARRLGQTSRFGAWLDVAVDNLGRGMLWSLLFKVLCLKHIMHTCTRQ
ncbi:E3 ubiquitin-protein ligase [Sarotherodon galilaeus]